MQHDEMRANRQIVYVSHQTRSDLVHIQILFIYQLSRIAKKKKCQNCVHAYPTCVVPTLTVINKSM